VGHDNPLRLLNVSARQQVLRRLDKAYRDFKQASWENRASKDGAGLEGGRLYT